MEVNEALVAILKKSHAQAMGGQAVSNDTLFIEFVKNARMDDATMLQKTNNIL